MISLTSNINNLYYDVTNLFINVVTNLHFF